MVTFPKLPLFATILLLRCLPKEAGFVFAAASQNILDNPWNMPNALYHNYYVNKTSEFQVEVSTTMDSLWKIFMSRGKPITIPRRCWSWTHRFLGRRRHNIILNFWTSLVPLGAAVSTASGFLLGSQSATRGAEVGAGELEHEGQGLSPEHLDLGSSVLVSFSTNLQY